ncbi:MAG: hypothetical protein HKO56_03795, partial [Bacteroidia bacterium]|nr:hypothetical protein [Bacteroidia bacterium]
MRHFSNQLKSTLLVLLTLTFSFNSNAQTERMGNQPNPFAETHSNQFINSSNQSTMPPPMWDVQVSIDATAAVGGAGNAGAVWVGNEYWVAEWASADIHRIDALGNFIATTSIPGITGTRGMSYDGTSVWIGNATGTVNEVDPSTLLSIGTITLPAGVTARQISYDSTANAGAGGLWVANVFGAGPTDIYQVDLSGTLLVTIPQTTHTLSGIYGFAVDHISTGGPYLWAFTQMGTGAEIHQLALPGGSPTGVVFDVNADLGLTGTAGGIFIDSTIVPGEVSIGCLLQDNPDILTVYELDYVPIDFDVAAEDLSFDPPYTQIPLSQLGPINFTGNASNNGLMTLTNPQVNISVND